MDKTLLDNTVAALRALIIAELDSTAVNRFQRAAKLCQQAHQISQMNAKRVSDVSADGNMMNPYGGINIIGGEALIEGENPGYDAPIAMRPRRNVQADTVDLLREIVTTFAPPKPQPKLEDTLGRLIELRDLALRAGRETPELDKQIDEMIAVETQKYLTSSKEPAHAPVPMVDPLVLRRSSAGEVGRETVPADHRQGDIGGAEGDREPVGDGAQKEVGHICAICND